MITNPRHIPFARKIDWQEVSPRGALDYLTEAKNNGNNVSLEEEGMSALNTQLLYTALTQAISGSFQRINIVLR